MLRDLFIGHDLSNREADVSALVVKAFTNKEVGNQLCICEKTVKFHLNKAYKKLKIKSRTELIMWVLEAKGIEL